MNLQGLQNSGNLLYIWWKIIFFNKNSALYELFTHLPQIYVNPFFLAARTNVTLDVAFNLLLVCAWRMTALKAWRCGVNVAWYRWWSYSRELGKDWDGKLLRGKSRNGEPHRIMCNINLSTLLTLGYTLLYVTLIVVLPCILISTKLFCQQMHLLLKHKMLQFIFKISFLIWLLHVSGSSDHHQGAYNGTLLKLVSLKSLVKTHR